jgi:hypothetical protein
MARESRRRRRPPSNQRSAVAISLAVRSLSLLYHAIHMGPVRTLWADIRSELDPSELDLLVAWLNDKDQEEDSTAGVRPARVRRLDDLT